MPDIGETNPINPIWPTKPGGRPKPRRRPKPPEDKDKSTGQQDKKEQNGPDGHPKVDDYA